MAQLSTTLQSLTIEQGADPKLTYTMRAPIQQMLYRNLPRQVLRQLPPLWEVPFPCLIKIGQKYNLVNSSVSLIKWKEYRYKHE